MVYKSCATLKDMQLEVVTPSLPTVREGLKTAHALISRNGVQVDKALLSDAPNLQVIGHVGAGIDGIDMETATTRGIIVMNTPGTNAIAAGEHAISLMLALSRKLVSAHDGLKEGWWLLDRKQQAGTQLFQKHWALWDWGVWGGLWHIAALHLG